MSFIFGGNTGQTYDQLQSRRRVADQLMAQNAQTPRNVGEGLSAIGRALAVRAIERRADEQEGRMRRDFQSQFASLFGGSPTTQNSTQQSPTAGAMGSGLPSSLIQSESGGDFLATNDVPGSGGVGHFGRGQFSQGRLQDAMRAGVIPQGTTPQQFLANPQMQQAVEQWHVGDVQNFIGQNGLDQYVGQTINGVQVTPQGMLAVAHLGGNAGLQRYLETGGQYNPSDANGTSLGDYMARHSGQGGQGAPQGQQAPTGPDMQRIAQLLSVGDSPMASPMQRQLVQMLIQQEMEAGQGAVMSPRDQIEFQRAQVGLERDRLALEEARNPPEPEPDEMTESERRIFLFNNIQTQTGPVIDQLETTTFDPASLRDRFGSTVIGGNFFREPEGRQYEAAASAWSEGALRIATGAAATPEEVERIRNTYFAQVGDDPATVEFKRQMRASYQEVLRATMAGDPNAEMPNPLMDFLNRPDEPQAQRQPGEDGIIDWTDL